MKHIVLSIGLAFFIFAAFIQPAFALPDEVTVNGEVLKRVSQGTRSKMFVDIYKVGLYLPSKDADLDNKETTKAFVVEILYDKNSAKGNIPDAWKEELLPTLGKQDVRALKSAADMLTVGAVSKITYAYGHDTHVIISSENIIADSGSDLFNAFTDIWMGEAPVSEALKSALLSGVQ